MLTMGLTLTMQDFKVVARRPWDFLVGVVAQFVIMPGVAYLLVKVWHLEPALALGILLVGCCPVAFRATSCRIFVMAMWLSR